MDNSKKAKRVRVRIFSNLVTIKAMQGSGITITNRNWIIVVDQCTGYKVPEFYYIKSDFVEPTCKKFSEWKNNGKMVVYIRHNHVRDNKVSRKIANDLHWKLASQQDTPEKTHHSGVNLLN